MSPSEDILHNPAFLVLLGVFATAFITIVVGVVGYLLKTVIDGIREDIKQASDERHETDKQRLEELGKQGEVLARLEIAEAQRIQREAADDRDRRARQEANEKRFALNEKAVTDLKAEMSRDFGLVQGRLDAALGRQIKDGN